MRSGDWGQEPEGTKTLKEAEMDAAKQRHPSGKDVPPVKAKPLPEAATDVLTAADRCDQGCGSGALYRVKLRALIMDFCHHHHHKLFPTLEAQGWAVGGTNPGLMEELYGGRNRAQGSDHA